MKPAVAVCLGSLLLLPAPAIAAAGSVVCDALHFIRAQGTELRTTLVSFRNLDLVHPATVRRITFRNALGEVVHDSGPDTPTPHPLNTDFNPHLNVTHVPPGASYYLATNHVWPQGFIGVNEFDDHSLTGQAMSVTVEFSKQGRAGLFVVGAVSRTRERFAPFAERARDGMQCTRLALRGDD